MSKTVHPLTCISNTISHYLKLGTFFHESCFLVRVVDGNYRIYLEIDELSYYVGTYGKRYNKVYKLELILDIHFNTNNEDLTYTIEDVQTTYKNYGIYLNQKDIQLSYDSDGDLDVLYNYVDNKVILLTINYFSISPVSKKI